MSTKIDEKIVREDLSDLFTSVLTDLTAMRAAIVGITAKLDADGGITDTDYAATWDPAVLDLAATD